MMIRAPQASLLAGILLSYLGCTADPLYCDENRRCMDPERPFCDLTGEYPASDGVARTCIPDPNADTGTGDGGNADGGTDAGGIGSDGGKQSDAGTICLARLAFYSYRDGNGEIYVGNADGTDQVNVTRSAASDSSPSWSPDGSKIAYVSEGQIWAMNADGTDAVQLTTGPADNEPNWSPDGTLIAFKRPDDVKGGSDIWTVEPTRGEPLRLTYYGVSQFSWSPDGAKLAYSKIIEGNLDIMTMNRDGTAQVNRTNDPSSDDSPAWSPDGSQIVFTSFRSGNDDLWIMEADGSNPRNLSDTPQSERDGSFSPDGSRIVYQRGVTLAAPFNLGTLESDIYSMNADGTGKEQLTFDPGEDRTPSFSPDGAHVAWIQVQFPAGRDVYVAKADGTDGLRVTPTGDDNQVVWQPCP